MGHHFVVFDIDNIKWIADGTSGFYTDLSRVKNNDETWGFGVRRFQDDDTCNIIVNNDFNLKKTINDIDEKLGYITNGKYGLFELIELLSDIKSGKIDIRNFAHNNEITLENKICFKLEFLFSKLGKLKSGFYEQKDFVYELETLLLTSQEREKWVV